MTTPELTTLYHGTHVEAGVRIALRGALLSDNEKFREEAGEEALVPPIDYESFLVSGWPLRYNTVHFNLREPGTSVDFAFRHEERDGGLLLELAFPTKTLAKINPLYEKIARVAIPRIVSLDHLVSVSLTPTASGDDRRRERIIRSFKKYHSTFYELDP